ncbi:MAG: hypothetical protein RLZZ271_1655 [Pseudomonadota bacterium]|jgi:hypothetical protein
MFGLFKAGPADEFGKELAAFFMERFKALEYVSQKKHAEKVNEILSKMGLKVDKFKQEEKPGVLQKAKLANSFRWALHDAGLEKAQLEELVAWLTRKMG